MKKLIAMICAAAICLSFASCGNDSNNNGDAEKTTKKLSSNLSQSGKFEMYTLNSDEQSKLDSLIKGKTVDKNLVIKSLKINGEDVTIYNPSCTTIVYNIPDTTTDTLDIKAEFSSKSAKTDINIPKIEFGKNTVTLTAIDGDKYNRYEVMVYRYDENTLKVYNQYVKIMDIFQLSEKIFKFDSEDSIKQNNMVYYNITNYDDVMKSNFTDNGKKLLESYASERLVEKDGKHYGMIVDFEPEENYNGAAVRYYINKNGETQYMSRYYALVSETETEVRDSTFVFDYQNGNVLADSFTLPF